MNIRALAGGFVLALSLNSQAAMGRQVVEERVDLDVGSRILEEGLTRSQLPQMIGYMTDVIGPRLTGSPGMTRANHWVADRLRSFGLDNVVVEPWGEFGRGWERVEYMGRILTPYVQPLNAHPLAWSGSTDGTVRARAVLLPVSDSTELEQYRDMVRGAFVLVDEAVGMEPEWAETQAPRRFSLEHVFDTAAPPRRPDNVIHRDREPLARAHRNAVMRFLADAGAAAYLQPSVWQYNTLRVGALPGENGRNPEVDPMAGLLVSHEQYGQIYRNVERGEEVELEVRVINRFHDDDLMAYNTLGEIPGTDLADEIVMLGAHLDSWHSGTGATDNASGSVVMMEAMRILKAVGVEPRRTIRIALWSGEEQGLLGSRNWVANHADELDHISAYVNVDNGTGKLRGIYDQGNSSAADIFRQILAPLSHLGVVNVRHQEVGGTDHLAFDRAGVPGFNFIQDPIEYSVRTHHSNVDTFDHLMLEDLQQAAAVVAWTVYHLATRDEMVPRKPAQ